MLENRSLLNKYNYMDWKIAGPAMGLVFALWIGGMVAVFLAMQNNRDESLFFIFMSIGLGGALVLVFLPIFVSAVQRKTFITHEGIRIKERPHNFLSLAKKKEYSYRWEDFITWREMTVMVGGRARNSIAIELFAGDNKSEIIRGDWFYINDKMVEYDEFFKAVEPNLLKIGRDSENLSLVKAKNPMKWYAIGFLFLGVVSLAGLVVLVYVWIVKGQIFINLAIPVVLGLIISISFGSMTIRK